MRNRLAIGFAALCVWVTTPSFGQEAAPSPAPVCRLKRLASLDLESTEGNQALVPVLVNGTEAWMMLDTGSAWSVISEGAVKALGLKERDFNGQTSGKINGQALKRVAPIDELKFGTYVLRYATLAVVQFSSATPPIVLGRPLIGHLGLDAFNDVDFELQLAQKKLNLFSQEHCNGKVVYWTNTYTEVPYTRDELGSIVFAMELDGSNIETTLNSSRAVTTIDPDVTREVYGFDENSPDISRSPGAAGFDDARYRAMALSAPGINISNTQIRLSRPTFKCKSKARTTGEVSAFGYSNCTGVTPLSLGLNVLATLRIYVATSEKVIYISRADAK